MEIIIEPCDLTPFVPSQANRFAKFTGDWNKLVTRVRDVNLDMIDALGEWTPVTGSVEEVLGELVRTSTRSEFEDLSFSMLRKYFADGEEVIDTYATVKNGTVLFRAAEEVYSIYDPNADDMDDARDLHYGPPEVDESFGDEWDD